MRKQKKHLGFMSMLNALREGFSKMQDARQESKVTYSLTDIGLCAFACMYFQDPSLLQFQKRMQKEHELSNFNRIFGISEIAEETQIRNCLDNIQSDEFQGIFNEIFRRLQKCKHIEQFQSLRSKYLVSIDATQYFTSNTISCPHCLTKESKGEVRYHHQAMQAALVHPKIKQVIPLCAEDIRNDDGKSKQDCEITAAKRMLPKLREAHPQLDMIIVGDALYSKHPMVSLVAEQRMNYIFTVKPTDHKYMFAWLEEHKNQVEHVTKDIGKGREFSYKLATHVPLESVGKSYVNYFALEIYQTDATTGIKKCTYRSSWITDMSVNISNVDQFVEAARCRWKIENECFNNLKNQGYCLEHNYGHGKNFLSFNFYLITLLAFLFHQVLELTDHMYQTCRTKWSKQLLWEKLRTLVCYVVFDSWERLLAHCLDPPEIISTAVI